MHNYRNGSGDSTIPTEVTGLQVALQWRSKKERAQLAAAIQRGETKLTKLTDGQIARICGVTPQYVYQARVASVDAYLRRLQIARTAVQLAAE
jgi:hypothetical protein